MKSKSGCTVREWNSSRHPFWSRTHRAGRMQNSLLAWDVNGIQASGRASFSPSVASADCPGLSEVAALLIWASWTAP